MWFGRTPQSRCSDFLLLDLVTPEVTHAQSALGGVVLDSVLRGVLRDSPRSCRLSAEACSSCLGSNGKVSAKNSVKVHYSFDLQNFSCGKGGCICIYMHIYIKFNLTWVFFFSF